MSREALVAGARMNDRSVDVPRKRSSWNKRPVAHGMKYCPACDQEKPIGDFSGKKRPDGYCRPCKSRLMTASRLRRHGKPDTTAAERFWPKVRKSDGCWEWMGSKKEDGYGFFVYQGRCTRAHRVALILSGVDVPPYDGGTGTGAVVDHICKNVGCVRPDHLRVVTQADNCGKLAKLTPHYINKLKTKCIRGHEFNPTNTTYHKRGRTCKVCRRMRGKS